MLKAVETASVRDALRDATAAAAAAGVRDLPAVVVDGRCRAAGTVEEAAVLIAQ